MRAFLSQSISSLNKNKLNGLMAELELRRYLDTLGFGQQVSVGGWIARNTGEGRFGSETVVLFPQPIMVDQHYEAGRATPIASHGLHTICATFRQIGIRSFYCIPSVELQNDTRSIFWQAKELGIPADHPPLPLSTCFDGFERRGRAYNYLRYKTDASVIPIDFVPEEFTKEHLRVAASNEFMAEISDVDGVFWGQQYTYPLEIKEKTPAFDRRLGHYFGLDVGPFVKLAYYAAKRGNLHSLFIVREIGNVDTRELVAWRYITFDHLAQFASWVQSSGGKNMQGGASSVVKIPMSEFSLLNADALRSL